MAALPFQKITRFQIGAVRSAANSRVCIAVTVTSPSCASDAPRRASRVEKLLRNGCFILQSAMIANLRYVVDVRCPSQSETMDIRARSASLVQKNI